MEGGGSGRKKGQSITLYFDTKQRFVQLCLTQNCYSIHKLHKENHPFRGVQMFSPRRRKKTLRSLDSLARDGVKNSESRPSPSADRSEPITTELLGDSLRSR